MQSVESAASTIAALTRKVLAKTDSISRRDRSIRSNPSSPRIEHRPHFATLLWRLCGLNSAADGWRCLNLACSLTLGPAHDRHQLFDLSALIGLVAGDDRTFDAMGDVVAQDFLLHAPKRGAHRRNLRHDVDAIAVLVDHAGDAAHLALDPAQALGARS